MIQSRAFSIRVSCCAITPQPNALIKKSCIQQARVRVSWAQHDISHQISVSQRSQNRVGSFSSSNPIWQRARKINPATCVCVDARPSFESKVCLSHAQRASSQRTFMQKKHTSKCTQRIYIYRQQCKHTTHGSAAESDILNRRCRG